MGVLNVTPDSFSDGGAFLDPEKAGARAEEMMHDGADFLDVGAESTAPNAPEVSAKEEWERLAPVLQTFREKNIPFSVDTYKAEVARRALKMGAQMINDVTALRGDPEMAQVLAEFPQAFLCLMYSKDSSARTTLQDLGEENIGAKIYAFFEERLAAAQKYGIANERIMLDPGMGAFLSTDPEKSFTVLKNLQQFQDLGCPILIGTSRKGFLKTVSGRAEPKDRVIASVVSALLAIQNGARIVRVHDVKEMKEALNTWEKVN